MTEIIATSQRQCEDWLLSYCEYTSEQESPEIFHNWVGISVVGSALGRRCYIDRGYYQLFPNLYIVLVGGSARVRKTTAIDIGYDIFQEALPHMCIIAQKITPEALISVLTAGTSTSKGGTIISGELSVFLGNSAQDDRIIQLLTDLYNCKLRFDYHTLSRGKEIAKNVYMNLLGATTPNWLKTSIPMHAIGGGFTSRIIFVSQSKPRRPIPRPLITFEQIEIKKKLINDLRIINQLSGRYEWSKLAEVWYDNWYEKMFNDIDEKGDDFLDGYYSRKHDTLLKVAMVISACRSNRMIIEEDDLQTALGIMEKNENYLPDILKTVLATLIGEEQIKVYNFIKKKRKVVYRDLLQHLSYCLNAKRLNEVLQTLKAEESIEEVFEDGRRYLLDRKK